MGVSTLEIQAARATLERLTQPDVLLQAPSGAFLFQGIHESDSDILKEAAEVLFGMLLHLSVADIGGKGGKNSKRNSRTLRRQAA